MVVVKRILDRTVNKKLMENSSCLVPITLDNSKIGRHPNIILLNLWLIYHIKFVVVYKNLTNYEITFKSIPLGTLMNNSKNKTDM